MKNKKINISILFSAIFIVGAVIYARSSMYNPGETLNPTCSPGESNCTVKPASGKFVDGSNSNNAVYTQGNVGIGLINPQYSLDTVGKILIRGNQLLMGDPSWDDDGHGSEKVIQWGWSSQRGDYLDYYVPGNSDAAENVKMSVLQNGNIGIGTTSPSAKLDVKGNLKITDSNNKTFEITAGNGAYGAMTKFNTNSYGYIFDKKISVGEKINSAHYCGVEAQRYQTYEGCIDFNSDTISLKPSPLGGKVILNGKIGIGTASPSKELDVSGDINFTGDLYKNGTLVDLSGDGTGSSLWTDNGSSTYLTQTGDKVGIGTTSPGEKLEVNGKIKAHNVYIGKASASANKGAGWYTIATGGSGRHTGRFIITDDASSRHQAFEFFVTHMYGNNDSADINILSSTRYSGTPIRYLRIKEYGTYDGVALQVYIDDSTNNLRVALIDTAMQQGWTVKNFIPDSQDPGGVSHYSDFSEAVRFDLDVIINGGMGTTGKLYAREIGRFDGGVQVDGKMMIRGDGISHITQYTDNNHYGYFEGKRNDGKRGYYLGYGNGSSTVNLNLDNANRLDITGGDVYMSDKLGIGTTSPSKKLDVNGDINFTGDLYKNGTIVNLSGGGASAINDLSDGKTGGNSVFLGNGSGVNDDESDNRNTAVGINTLNSNTTGYFNTANGYQALYSNTTGNRNTANGYQALYSNISAYYNTANGYQALYSNTNGDWNTANGYWSLYSNIGGAGNIANGYKSLYSNTTGDNNVAVGRNSLYSNTTGSNNIAVGFRSGSSLDNGNSNTSSSKSVYLGYDTRAKNSGDANEIVIGAEARGNGSNTVTIGNSNITDNYFSGDLHADSYLYNSDKRLKKDITKLENYRDILKIDAVRFNWKKDGKADVGIIAQEVQKYFPEFVHKGQDGFLAVDYPKLAVPMLNLLQEQEKRLNKQEKEIQELKKMIKKLQK